MDDNRQLENKFSSIVCSNMHRRRISQRKTTKIFGNRRFFASKKSFDAPDLGAPLCTINFPQIVIDDRRFAISTIPIGNFRFADGRRISASTAYCRAFITEEDDQSNNHQKC
uniref:Uncharacterized protein n=1 Tax=Romanomermis culicivorax TaxID=13658 RepID=A0A915LDA1_ROMCU